MHTHKHIHDLVNPSGQQVHEIHHIHEHKDEVNYHHHYIEEPGYYKGEPDYLR